ncbi:MAG: amidohydrolase [Eggerthellaceae bacterium]|nr:amidohydrolase [Eggerthellaceae bacterium]
MLTQQNFGLDVVDTQVHIGPGGIQEMLGAMKAVGVKSVLLDEYWFVDMTGKPYVVLENEEIRPILPTAEVAALTYPESFAYLRRIKRRDPEAVSLVRQVADSPYGKAIRLDVGLNPLEVMQLGEGGFDHILAAAQECGLPVFIYASDYPEVIEGVANRFPNLKIIIDHCGVFSGFMREQEWTVVQPCSWEEHLAMYDKVLALAKYPNVALKWSHASEIFAGAAYPGDTLVPYLRKAIDAFGSERVMWASDHSALMTGETWAETLFGVKGVAGLTDEEKANVLGKTARAWLNWPAE